MGQAAEIKSLKIKTGVVRRLHKELNMYRKEVELERAKVESLKSTNSDPYDIKYAEQILAESAAMVPDNEQRLQSAIEILKEHMEKNKALKDEAEYTEAEQEITIGEKLLI